MKNKATSKSHHKQKAAPVAKKKNPLWIVLLVLALGALGSVLWQNFNAHKETTSIANISNPDPTGTGKDRLVGRWVRTDSNDAYVIEIRHATSGGKLEASYFNPNPIHVARAEWQSKNNNLEVVIELRDANYPGSTYTLSFLDAENRMTGIYYQAVEGANYDVEFVREQ